MRVYHFAEARWALDDLEKKRLKVCQFLDLNDPFELLGVELGGKAIRKTFKRWAQTIAQQYGLLCFSSSWHHPLMWSHYGDRHKGICLGFDIPDHMLRGVAYSTERLLLDIDKALGSNGSEPTQEVAERLLITKFRDWTYEAERRVIIPLGTAFQDGKHCFRQFSQDLKPAEVIAGPRCSVPEERINGAVKRLPGIEIIKGRLAFKSFRVVKNQRGFATSK